MPKPNYLSLFAQLEVTTDPVQRQLLLDQLYDFSPPVPLPPGESIEDYLLTPAEIEKFAYVEDDYVVPNPGTIIGDSGELYVLSGYVADGYINIESSTIPPYVLDGYVAEGYIAAATGFGDFSAYVGVYYNDLGEST